MADEYDPYANVPTGSDAYVVPDNAPIPVDMPDQMPVDFDPVSSEFLPSIPEFESAPSFAAEVPAPSVGPTLAAATPEQGVSFMWSPPAGTDPSLVLGGIYQSLGVTPANVKVNQVSSGSYKIFVPLREMNQAGVAAASSMKAGTSLSADGSLQYGGIMEATPQEAGLPGWMLAAEAARRGSMGLAKEIAASLATKGGGAAAVSAAQAEAAALANQTTALAVRQGVLPAVVEETGLVLRQKLIPALVQRGLSVPAAEAVLAGSGLGGSAGVGSIAAIPPAAALTAAGAVGHIAGSLARMVPVGDDVTFGEGVDDVIFNAGVKLGLYTPTPPALDTSGKTMESYQSMPQRSTPVGSKARDYAALKDAPAPIADGAVFSPAPLAEGESLIEPGPKADAAAQALADASKPGLVARTPPTSEILAKQATGKAPSHTAFWDTADKIKDDPVMINALMSNDASQIGGFDKATIARNLPLLKAEAAQIPPEDTAKAAVYSQAISLLETKLGTWSPDTQIASAKALAKNPMQLVNIPAGADPAKVSSYITGSQSVAAAATNLQTVANSNPTATELDQAETGLRMAVASAYSTGMTYAPGFLQNENAFGMTQWNPQGLMMAGGLGLSLYEIFYRAPQERKDQQEWQMLMYQMSKEDSIAAEERAVEQQKELYAFKAETDEETSGSAESTSKPYVPDL